MTRNSNHYVLLHVPDVKSYARLIFRGATFHQTQTFLIICVREKRVFDSVII